MPEHVEFENGSLTSYVYDAEGTKLRTVYSIPEVIVRTDYCGGLLFENDVPAMLLTETGYLGMSDGLYRHYIHDHLGNVRVVRREDGTVEETDDYYPFGGRLETAGEVDVQPYKYSGKELESRYGIGWYDFGARRYDPILARWTTPDPLLEKNYGVSPYAFCNNNPVNFVDPDGEHPVVVGAVIGGAISGTAAIIKGKSFTEVIAATAGGAVDGAIAASGFKVIGKLGSKLAGKLLNGGLGVAGGGAGDIVEQGLNVLFGNQEKIDLKGAVVSAAVGMVSTGVTDSVEEGLKSMAKSEIGSQSTYEAVEKEVKAKIKSTGRNPNPGTVKSQVKTEIKEMEEASSMTIQVSVKAIDGSIEFYNKIFDNDE